MVEKKLQKKFLVLFKSEKMIMESLNKKQLKLYKLLRKNVVEYDFDFGIALTSIIKNEKILPDFEKNLLEVVELFKSIHQNSDKHPPILLQTINKIDEKFVSDSCKYFTELKHKQDNTVTFPLINYLKSSQNLSQNYEKTSQNLVEKSEKSVSNLPSSEQLPLKNESDQKVTEPLLDIDIDIVRDIDIDIGIDNKEKNINTKKEKPKKFTPPTVEEISSYCQEKNIINVDPEYFFDHYQANGWKVGSNKMSNWKATVNNWHRRNSNKSIPETVPKKTHGDLIDDFLMSQINGAGKTIDLQKGEWKDGKE